MSILYLFVRLIIFDCLHFIYIECLDPYSSIFIVLQGLLAICTKDTVDQPLNGWSDSDFLASALPSAVLVFV